MDPSKCQFAFEARLCVLNSPQWTVKNPKRLAIHALKVKCYDYFSEFSAYCKELPKKINYWNFDLSTNRYNDSQNVLKFSAKIDAFFSK